MDTKLGVALQVRIVWNSGHNGHLISASPVLLALKHPFPQHTHNLWVVLVSEGELSQLLHQGPRSAPGVIVSGLADFGFHLTVVHDHIGPTNV